MSDKCVMLSDWFECECFEVSDICEIECFTPVTLSAEVGRRGFYQRSRNIWISVRGWVIFSNVYSTCVSVDRLCVTDIQPSGSSLTCLSNFFVGYHWRPSDTNL